MAANLLVRDARLLDGRHGDLIVTAGCIERFDPRPEGRDGHERDLGPGPPAMGDVGPARPVIHAGGRLCTRPYADAHLHLDKAGTADRLPEGALSLGEAMEAMKLLKDEERNAVAAVAERMVRMVRLVLSRDTVALRAVVDVDRTWGLTSFRAALSARQVLADECTIRIVAFPQDGLDREVTGLLAQAIEEGADVVGAHTDVDVDPVAHLRAVTSIAQTHGVPVEVHVDEGARADRFFLPQVLDEMTEVDLTIVHCLSLGTLPEDDQARWASRIAERSIPVCVAPSVLSLGVPLAPVRRLIEAGVDVVIGSDNLQDVFCPIGTGRAVDNARLVATAGQLTTADLHAAAVRAATDASWGLVTGLRAPIEPGSPATFVVHEARTPSELLRGVDGTRWAVRDGRVRGTTATASPS